jgi:hypothetical protein
MRNKIVIDGIKSGELDSLEIICEATSLSLELINEEAVQEIIGASTYNRRDPLGSADALSQFIYEADNRLSLAIRLGKLIDNAYDYLYSDTYKDVSQNPFKYGCDKKPPVELTKAIVMTTPVILQVMEWKGDAERIMSQWYAIKALLVREHTTAVYFRLKT